MENKGIVRRSKEGRAHRYVPAVERQKAQKAALKSLAKKFFRGSLAADTGRLFGGTDRRHALGTTRTRGV